MTSSKKPLTTAELQRLLRIKLALEAQIRAHEKETREHKTFAREVGRAVKTFQSSRSPIVPDYLSAYEDWSYDDFVRDIRKRGYTLAQAKRHALRYSWLLGKLRWLAPPLPAGWVAGKEPYFADGGKVAFFARKGSVSRLFTKDGKPTSPEFKRIRDEIEWTGKNGWYAASGF